MFEILRTAAVAGLVAGSAMTTAAQAEGWIVGLVDGKSIVTIDPASRKVASKVNIRGAGMVLGIDVRPADGTLYGVTSDGHLVTIDPRTGQATMRVKLSQPWMQAAATIFDFNPAADRLRLMNSEGTSLRINVDDGMATVDGSHRFKDTDANAGKTPRIVAGAYTNSYKGTKTTTLYNIDAATGSLVTQAPPNDGILNTVGPLGISVKGPVAFNIVATGPDQNAAWLAANGLLYSVDLKTGKATMAGKLQGLIGTLIDIAWVD
jgi:Domain of unknown function (DUF4394)